IWSACLSAWPIFTSPSAPPWGNGSWVPPGSGGSCLSSSSSWGEARTGTSATASTARSARRVGLIDRRGGAPSGPPPPPTPRQPARVIPADVGRRLAVDGRTALEQRHAGRSLATAAHHARRDEVRHEASEHLLRERCGLLELRRRHQRDLDARAEVEIERAEEAAEGRRVTSHQISHRAQRGERVTLVALVAGERGETQQHLDGDRRAAGH